MNIIWTTPAFIGLNKAIDYTKTHFPENKKKLKHTLENTQKQLIQFPFSGNMMEAQQNIFRMILPNFPFCLTYKVQEKNIFILSFVHQSQAWE